MERKREVLRVRMETEEKQGEKGVAKKKKNREERKGGGGKDTYCWD